MSFQPNLGLMTCVMESHFDLLTLVLEIMPLTLKSCSQTRAYPCGGVIRVTIIFRFPKIYFSRTVWLNNYFWFFPIHIGIILAAISFHFVEKITLFQHLSPIVLISIFHKIFNQIVFFLENLYPWELTNWLFPKYGYYKVEWIQSKL